MLTREDCANATGAPPAVKGLVWFTGGSKMKDGAGAGVYGQSVRRRLSFPLGRYATIFQAEIYAILDCAYEIQSQNRPEKYVSVCSDSLAALKARYNNVSFGLSVPKGVEWHLYPACGGPSLGPRACWNTR